MGGTIGMDEFLKKLKGGTIGMEELVRKMTEVNDAFTEANWRERLSETDRMLLELQTNAAAEYHSQRAELAKKLLLARVQAGVFAMAFDKSVDDSLVLADTMLWRLRDDLRKALEGVEREFRTKTKGGK